MAYDVVVIGSGPGGYVAAIRAAQLGFKTAIIERESLGGICLNWGCIPTKALLKTAQVVEYIKHAESYGIEASGKPKFDAIIKRSRGVADKMSKGVQFLMRKNKIDVINGFGKLVAKGKIDVTGSDNKKQTVEAKHIILATGARSRELPNLKIDGKKVTRGNEVEVRGLPEGAVFSRDGRYLYVGNYIDRDITILRVEGDELVNTGKSLQLPAHPASMRGPAQ